VDNSRRELHGALLDAEILADVYLTMTGGQTALQLSDTAINGDDAGPGGQLIKRLPDSREKLPVISATAEEIAAHEAQLDLIATQSGGRVMWRELIK
jgi:DNA polymerase-3 subunit epsilon